MVPLRGAAARIVDNMTASLAIPMATSQRIIPVKVIDENRRIINLHRDLQGGTKVSYTHLIAWGILKAIEAFAVLNSAYAEKTARLLASSTSGSTWGLRSTCRGGADHGPWWFPTSRMPAA